MEASAGMAVYFIIFAESGFRMGRLVGIRKVWDCKDINDVQDDYGQGWTMTVDFAFLQHLMLFVKA
jgi:hypothetical protein